MWEAAAASSLSDVPLRDLFDTPDLNNTDDLIANGEYDQVPGEPAPLAPFTAQRIDYSLARLSHYTATSASHFQNFVLFTNYQFYIDEFAAWARQLMKNGGEGHTAFVEPGNIITPAGSDRPETDAVLGRLPQMPAYHLKKRAMQALRWSISASALPTPRRSPTISPCCARMPG